MSDILIVDDERDIRDLIADILRTRAMHDARGATPTNRMAALINATPPALMILDIWLQGQPDGRHRHPEIVKRDNPDIPVVIISGHGNIEIAVAAIKQGAYDFIEKPFNIDQLLVVIRRAMEASRLRRENATLRARDIAAAR
jgi:two-component system nitrogen regulation response regulator NtrX